MKKIILAGLLIITNMLTANAQASNPNIPNNIPRGSQLVLPKTKTLKKLPDLSVAFIDVISAEYNEESAAATIKVSIKVNNNGTAAAAASQVHLSVYTDSFDGTDHVIWQLTAEPFEISTLNSGQSVTRFAVFTSNNLKKDKTYRSKIRIDVGNAIEELNESNNQSAEFTLAVL
jgi:subtilase family serine protease